VRAIDFENSGRSATWHFELAEVADHLATSTSGLDIDQLDIDQLVCHIELTTADVARFREARRLGALSWRLMLLPAAVVHHRHPPGSARRLAERLLALLD
jgi:hypothetical protein